ncbi:MAG: c-type cytochrome, partial [Nitrospinae bacterium]|nr:c-type cytochrome [Nitrospinota bacterium]
MLIAALTAMLWVLGAAFQGGMAVYAQPLEHTRPYAELIAEGKELFLEAGCYACHGLNAKGSFGPDLTHLRKTDAEIFGLVMESYKGKITNMEGWKIIAYLRSLAERYTPEYTHAECLSCHEKITPKIVQEWRDARDGELTNTQCLDCHGSNHAAIIRSKG